VAQLSEEPSCSSTARFHSLVADPELSTPDLSSRTVNEGRPLEVTRNQSEAARIAALLALRGALVPRNHVTSRLKTPDIEDVTFL